MFRRGPLKRGHGTWGHEQFRRRGPMLTVTRIRALKPAQRPFKVFDSDGLFLLVQPSGALFWRFRYRKFGVERNL
ncbi:Arm DNA-binding domain-containing protein, partial [Sphingomonas sp.]|uniref:Arm DNA-binding domain-containing protein n=1 Tax=Sphingomonas sp. TaxID=28214 RepID=UPI003D6D0332